MPRLVHLSDLHFGRERPEVLDPLRSRIRELDPDLVVVSSDITQRATRREFELARSFVNGLERHVLVVPGNHDVPLYQVGLRLLTPLRRWHEGFGAEPEPCARVGDVAAVGLCSAHGWTLKHGRLTGGQRRRLAGVLRDVPQAWWRVLVVHHPLVTGEDVDRVARGADRMLRCLREAGVDMILCGHEHRSWARLATGAPHAGPGVLVVHAGTATSDRVRGEGNCFNVVDMEGDEVIVTVETYRDAGSRWAPLRRTSFVERGRWRLVESAPA